MSSEVPKGARSIPKALGLSLCMMLSATLLPILACCSQAATVAKRCYRCSAAEGMRGFAVGQVEGREAVFCNCRALIVTRISYVPARLRQGRRSGRHGSSALLPWPRSAWAVFRSACGRGRSLHRSHQYAIHRPPRSRFYTLQLPSRNGFECGAAQCFHVHVCTQRAGDGV